MIPKGSTARLTQTLFRVLSRLAPDESMPETGNLVFAVFQGPLCGSPPSRVLQIIGLKECYFGDLKYPNIIFHPLNRIFKPKFTASNLSKFSLAAAGSSWTSRMTDVVFGRRRSIRCRIASKRQIGSAGGSLS
jgi:hypothetical protein